MRPGSDPEVLLSREDLRLLARIEGRPLPRGEALGAQLGLGAAAARRLIARFRRLGVLGFAAAVRMPRGACECVSYLRIDWSGVADPDALEDRLRCDPAIVVADRILGSSDYRVFSRHRDYRAANVWLRQVTSEPEIGQMTTRFCTALRDQPCYAAARLAGEPDDPLRPAFEP
jgi:hypothetical protein